MDRSPVAMLRCSVCAEARSSAPQGSLTGRCNGASPAAPEAAMKLHQRHNGASPVSQELRCSGQCCNGAPPRLGLQRSFAGTPRAGGCNGERRLQWSSVTVAMELRRDADGAAWSFFSRHRAAMELQWSFPGGRRCSIEALFSIGSGVAALVLRRWLRCCCVGALPMAPVV